MGNEQRFVTPLVSILIPVKNGAEFLLEAVDSCLAQKTGYRFEVVLVDDHSTDETSKIIKELTSAHPNIRGLTNIGSGVGAALQTGLVEARGSIILRLDSDDRMSPKRIETQVQTLLADNQLVMCGSQIELFGQGSASLQANHYPLSNSEICRFMQWGNAFADPSVAFRKDVAIIVGGFPTKLNGAEQYSLWLRMSKVGKVKNVPEILTSYRIHPSQFTKSRVPRVVFATILVQILWMLGVTQLRLKLRLGLRTKLESGVGQLLIARNIPKYLMHVLIAWVRT